MNKRAALLVVVAVFHVPSFPLNVYAAPKPPTRQQALHLLFQHWNTPLGTDTLDFGQTCRTNTLGCLLEGIALAMVEDSVGTQSHHGWSTIDCRMREKKALLIYVQEAGIYHRRFPASLQEHPGSHVWECTVAWGVSKGEVVWHQELRFSLSLDKKKLVPYSFGAVNTP